MENLIGTKLEPTTLHKENTLREFHSMSELVRTMSRTYKAMSWGAHKYTKFSEYTLGFKVQGHHLKGWVFLVVNGSDLFDIIYTNTRKKVVDVSTDVYLDNLIDVIDQRVEYIDEYTR